MWIVKNFMKIVSHMTNGHIILTFGDDLKNLLNYTRKTKSISLKTYSRCKNFHFSLTYFCFFNGFVN